MQSRASRLIIGIGNILRGDDGIGVRAVERLADLPLPDDVEVYEAGTLGLDAAYEIERREKVVVIDAIDAGAEPGAIFRLSPEELRSHIAPAVSLHQVHLLDALAETDLMRIAPKEVVFFTVQVADISAGIGLSSVIEQTMEKVLRLVLNELDLPTEILSRAAEFARARTNSLINMKG